MPQSPQRRCFARNEIYDKLSTLVNCPSSWKTMVVNIPAVVAIALYISATLYHLLQRFKPNRSGKPTWLLAGGELTATTQDAWDEETLDLQRMFWI